MAFNQKEYIGQYNREHYSRLSVDLPKEIKEELVRMCNRQGISIRKFIVDAIERAKKNLK
jgi:predicted HicB family RNase H-like nuclease